MFLYKVRTTCVSVGIVYALFFLPSFAHANTADGVGTSTTTSVSEDNATSTVEAPVSLLGLYPTEGVPGGDRPVGDFVVGPGKVDISLKPGQSKIVEIGVTNRTGERRRFNISVEDAEGSNDVNTPVVLLGDDRGPYSIRDYISVPHRSFELDSNERARIPVTISIPPDAEPGGLYGSVLIDTVSLSHGDTNDDANGAPASALVARIGTLFFVTIPGGVEHKGALTSFTTIPEKHFYQDGPIDFGILFENTGSIHLAPYGEIRIQNMFGEEVGFLTLDPWFVLPHSVRLREVHWDRKLLFGRYTATASINRSYDDTVDTYSYTFWILPWKPIAMTFGGLFVVFFIIRFFFKTFEFKRRK